MKQSIDFISLENFIDHLKGKKEIIGILQYGNRDYKNMSPGGDYDLNIIIDKEFETSIAGLHLHVNSIPVDCGIISVNDLFLEQSPSDYHCVLINSEILYDRDGTVTKQLKLIKEKWKLNITPISEGEIAFERFIKRHIVDKFENRLYENEVYTRLFLCGNIFSLLETYMKINELNPYSYKNALLSLKEKDENTYLLFERFVTTLDLEELLSITKEINENIFKKYNGVWNSDEIVFHYKDHSDKLSIEDKLRISNLVF